MRPLIGILSTYSEDTQLDYIKAIEKSNGAPITISRVASISSLNSIIDKLDGIIFTGGSDINPHCYNSHNPQYGLGKVDPDRDDFEISLVKKILSDTQISVLGICRGMQLLNVATGGNLYQNIEKQVPNSINHWLKDIYPRYYPSHEVSINKNSKIYSIFNKETLFVNSFHHQAINTLSPNFIASMHSIDGLVEAIEIPGDRFVVGVQWHPEMMVDKYPLYLNLFKSFIKSCSTPNSD
ncbi:MAG: gamma-glutamyl-gamma-aminobutyrate hydrolase family protein [Gudongella sp.]|nr:gamma-glutamyl-gamma-aminobutyrate hydrolase family protein [Gudongella sp.]